MNILTVLALLLVPASPNPAAIMPAQTFTASPVVIVKLGDASLEEYQGGDPASRVQLTRSN